MYYVNKSIENLYRVKFHDQRGTVLRLDMNENPVGLPLEFVEEVKAKITPAFLAAYPEKDELISLIAHHDRVDEDCITLTAGSDEAMRMIFQCFGKKGGDSITVSPTFELYDVYSKMFGLNHVCVEYNEDFTVSVDDILNKITEQTSIVILLNPNSPIGTVYREDEILRVIDKSEECGAIVVLDEAYHYFYNGTYMSLIHTHDNVIVLRTFSKVCSIAGLRVGYAVSNKRIITVMEHAESTFNVNSVGILFASEIFKRPDIMEEICRKEEEGRRWLISKLKESGYKYVSGEGNYILFKPEGSSGELVRQMKEYGVWVRDYSSGILSGWIRVSTGEIGCMVRFWDVYERCGGR